MTAHAREADGGLHGRRVCAGATRGWRTTGDRGAATS
jgi:hypothetical protein